MKYVEVIQPSVPPSGSRFGSSRPASQPKQAAAPVVRRPGRLAMWLPMVAAMMMMPSLAYVTTTYYLVPQLQNPSSALSHRLIGKTRNAKVSVPLTNIVVNVSGSGGQHVLLASMTLIGTNPKFNSIVEDNRDHLMDVTSDMLSNKTMLDLQMPDIRKQVRGELVTSFNRILGRGTVKELYLTEFAVE